MGMTASFAQVSPEQLNDPGSIDLMEFVMGGGDSISIDKSWMGIHFLLTGEAWGGGGPAGMVVMGGQAFGADMGYGPPRYFTALEVRTIASYLDGVTHETLQSNFDPNAMMDVYAFDAENGEEEFEYLCDYFDELKAFYQDAAKKENGMILFLV